MADHAFTGHTGWIVLAAWLAGCGLAFRWGRRAWRDRNV